MSYPGEPHDPLRDEVLAKYPDLARARNLFIEFFRDRSPLVNLGYSGKQILFAQPVLRLLTQEGHVNIDLPNYPYLVFTNTEAPPTEELEIYHLPSRNGYYLDAARVPGDFITALTTHHQVFTDQMYQVAHIALFQPEVDLNNLTYLVRELSQGFTYTEATFGYSG